MYTIKSNNTEIEAVDKELEENENSASILTFKLLPNSTYFNKLKKFITPIQLYKNNSKIFDGRVIDVAPSMNDDGSFEYEVTCEDRLNYLNDIRVGKWDVHPDEYTPDTTESETEVLDPAEIKTNFNVDKMISLILDTYNSKVLDDKKIYKGVINVSGNVTCKTDRETCLNTLIDKLINKKGGFVKLREENNKWYLDYTVEPQISSTSKIEIAVNMKSIKKQSTLDSVITRIIPIGKDGLTIKSVNNNIEYVQNDTLISTYGIVESVVKWDDVTEASNLLSKAQAMLSTINNDIYSIDCSALDLSTIQADVTEFEISQSCNLVNSIIGMNESCRIISKKTPLDEPWNTSLGFSNNPPSAINQSVSNRQAISNINTQITYANDSIKQKLSEGQFNTLFEQTTKKFEFTIGDPAGDTNVIMDKTGLTVKNGAIAIKNSNNEVVMTVDSNGNLTTNRLMVVGDGSNTVQFTGKGNKFINLNSSDGGAVFVYFGTGNAVGRVGTYPNRDEIFLEAGTIGQTERGKIILRGINSTQTENEPCDLEVHGNIGCTGVVKQNVAEGWESS